MAKMNKDFETRMQGMLYALKIAKADGIEALAKEIKMRGITRLDLTVPEKYIEETLREVCNNLYANVVTAFLWTLHETEGWGRVRLSRLKENYDKVTLSATDLDYLGEHYVNISDYAKELNNLYNLGIDVDRLDETRKSYDAGDGRYHMANIEKIIGLLADKGYAEASDFLNNYLQEEIK